MHDKGSLNPLLQSGLLLGGIRSAAFEGIEDKLRPLVINSLLETNLGMPYIYFIYLAYSSRFTEDMRRRGERITLIGRILENNSENVRNS